MAKAKKTKAKPKARTALKRPKFVYKASAMQDAIDAVRGTMDGGPMSCKAAAEKFNVPRSTLRKKLKGSSSAEDRQLGPAAVLGAENEERLVKWALDLSSLGFPVTKTQLLDSVARLVRFGKLKVPFQNGRPGRKWYDSFLKRHPILAERASQNLTRSRANVTKEDIIQWSVGVETYLKSKGLFSILKESTRVFNADESALFFCPKAGCVLAKKGDKNVYSVVNGDEKENLTIMMGGNAAGALLPPMIVFKYERIPDYIANTIPDTWGVGRSESGWMICPVFYEYIANIVIPWLDTNKIKRPVLFFMDGHASHLSFHASDLCRENGIELIALHPNSTHLTQPMDVSVFHALKEVWKNSVTEWRLENSGKELKKENFSPLLGQVIEDVIYPEILQNGFKKCGIVPWNVNAVDFSKIRGNPESEISSEPYALRNIKITITSIESEIGELKVREFKKNVDSTLEKLSLPPEDINLFKLWLSFHKKLDQLLAAQKSLEEKREETRSRAKLKAEAKAKSKGNKETNLNIIGASSINLSQVTSDLDINSLAVEMNLNYFPTDMDPFNSPSAIHSTNTSSSKVTDSGDLSLLNELIDGNLEEDLMTLITAPGHIQTVHVEINERLVDLSKPSPSGMPMNDLSEPSRSSMPMNDLSTPSKSETARNDSLKKNIHSDSETTMEVSEKSCRKEINIANNSEENMVDKSNNFNKDVPSPFKKACLWPEKIKKKNQKKNRSSEVMPSAITSTPWKQYWQNKKQKKEDEERAKEERKAIREQKKREKEEKQKEKEAKKSVPKKKPKLSRQLFIDPSTSSDENSDTVDDPPSPISGSNEALAIGDLQKDKYVIFLYEGEYFPGIILEASKTGAKLKAMTMAGPDGWRWPDKEDIFNYDLADIKEVIEPPVVRNSRGVFSVQEMLKYRK